MYCKNCGNQVEPNSTFCNKCGSNLVENNGVLNVKKFLVHKKLIISIIIVIAIIVPLMYYILNLPPKNVRKEVYQNAIQWTEFFEEHKKNNYQSFTNTDSNNFSKFINQYKSDATPEEKAILDELTLVMLSYGLEAVGYGNKTGEHSFDNTVLEMKALLKK